MSGTQPFGTVVYSTVRYHTYFELSFDPSTISSPCGYGVANGGLYLRPLTSPGGTAMAAEQSWNVPASSFAKKIWLPLGTWYTTNFRFQGRWSAACGTGSAGPVTFSGTLNY